MLLNIKEQSMSEANEIDEVDAMKQVAAALKGLDAEAVGRVLRWANDRYRQPAMGGARPLTGHVRPPAGAPGGAGQASVVELPGDLAEFYSAAHPETEADRALAIACWIQHVRGDADFDAQSVNKELKHLGDGVGNITQAFTKLMGQKPQLVIQTRKGGTTRQARKRYKVTAAGLAAVKLRMSAAERA
jgi:hypothetical protein